MIPHHFSRISTVDSKPSSAIPEHGYYCQGRRVTFTPCRASSDAGVSKAATSLLYDALSAHAAKKGFNARGCCWQTIVICILPPLCRTWYLCGTALACINLPKVVLTVLPCMHHLYRCRGTGSKNDMQVGHESSQRKYPRSSRPTTVTALGENTFGNTEVDKVSEPADHGLWRRPRLCA